MESPVWSSDEEWVCTLTQEVIQGIQTEGTDCDSTPGTQEQNEGTSGTGELQLEGSRVETQDQHEQTHTQNKESIENGEQSQGAIETQNQHEQTHAQNEESIENGEQSQGTIATQDQHEHTHTQNEESIENGEQSRGTIATQDQHEQAHAQNEESIENGEQSQGTIETQNQHEQTHAQNVESIENGEQSQGTIATQDQHEQTHAQNEESIENGEQSHGTIETQNQHEQTHAQNEESIENGEQSQGAIETQNQHEQTHAQNEESIENGEQSQGTIATQDQHEHTHTQNEESIENGEQSQGTIATQDQHEHTHTQNEESIENGEQSQGAIETQDQHEQAYAQNVESIENGEQSQGTIATQDQHEQTHAQNEESIENGEQSHGTIETQDQHEEAHAQNEESIENGEQSQDTIETQNQNVQIHVDEIKGTSDTQLQSCGGIVETIEEQNEILSDIQEQKPEGPEKKVAELNDTDPETHEQQYKVSEKNHVEPSELGTEGHVQQSKDTENESSDDDIPLSRLKQRETHINDDNDDDLESAIDSEDSYKPTKADINSSDSSLSLSLNENTETDSENTDWNIPIKKKIHTKKRKQDKMKAREAQMKPKEDLAKSREFKKKKKTKGDQRHNMIETETQSTENSKTYKESLPSSMAQTDYSNEQMVLQTVKEISEQQAEYLHTEQDIYEKKLEELLDANGLERQKVPADGNCFFKSALIHVPYIKDEEELRQILCGHIVDNAHEYVAFFSNNDSNESFEDDIIWIDFRTEVEELKGNGKWTNRAADLLPLALSNWSKQRIKMFTSLSHKPVVDITPTLCEPEQPSTIYLCFITSDDNSIPSHYDGCVKVGTQVRCRPTEEENQSNLDIGTDQNSSAENHPKTPAKPKNRVGRPRGTPPRKLHTFMTPPKKKLFRKRKATPDEWKKNTRKRLKMSGKEYVSQRGKLVPSKIVKSVDCSKCKYKCNQNISEENRQNLFDLFWSLDTYERKKDFIISRIDEKGTRKYIEPAGKENGQQKRKRDIHRSYFFDVEGNKITVCKKFFKRTLDVGDAYIDNAMKNQSAGVYVGSDKRGKHKPHNKTSDEVLEKVRSHIESFPAVEGHYTRKSSNRKYLGAELNIPKMYKLYLDYYKASVPEDKLASLTIYRKVFNEEYNFSFHVPKKDQCNVCVNYNRGLADKSITEEEKKNYYEHQQMKMRSRAEKKTDKEQAKSTTDTFVATFDLQAVLQTPCSLVSQIYYMRKLNCYNLSIYNLATQNATCFLWSEVEAKRGACEIGSCLYLQLMSLASNIKHVILYSDACAGQNRNQFTATGLLHAVINLPNIEVIDHKFLESGHTQMECDSMHSAIEFAKKSTEIYIPSQWSTVVRMARRKNPYSVVPIQHEDVYDLKQLQKIALKYSKQDSTGEKINWLKIKWIRYSKAEEEHVLFKYNFDEEFRRMRVIEQGKNGQPKTSLKGQDLPRKYKTKQAITLAKKKDLLNLCKTRIIPTEYHEYYKNLTANGKIQDRLPVPDIEEEDQDSDKE